MEIKENQLVLSIETATRNCSLAVLRGTPASDVCALWTGEQTFSASENLLIEIQRLLQQAGTELREVHLLVVTIGPGSFTSLRVGLAIAKGLAAARQIPLIGIPTLEALALEQVRKTVACSILPAGRNEFFAQIFRPENDLNSDRLQTGELAQLLDQLKRESNLRIVAPSEEHEKIKDFIESQQIKNWVLAAPPQNLAVCAGQIALDRLQNKSLNTSNQIIYGRDAVVVRKKSEKSE